MRKTILASGGIYHIYNRGVEKRDIFLAPGYYSRFTTISKHYLRYDYPYSLLKRRLQRAASPQTKKDVFTLLETRRIEPPVEVISFVLMPNHYHLTLKQLTENGITQFMHRLGTAYTGYFNIRQERSGRLFESSFKAVRVESEEQLIHLTRYQHLNPHGLGLTTTKELVNYPWSSLSSYLGERKFDFVSPEAALSHFGSGEEYLKFISSEVDEFEPMLLDEVAIDDDFGWFEKFRALQKEIQKQFQKRYLKARTTN